MPLEEVVCPACSGRLQVPPSRREGGALKCPLCGTRFAIGKRQVMADLLNLIASVRHRIASHYDV
jgi:hypothetical protein